MNKLWYIHITEHYLAIKKKEGIIDTYNLNESSGNYAEFFKSEKVAYCMIHLHKIFEKTKLRNKDQISGYQGWIGTGRWEEGGHGYLRATGSILVVTELFILIMMVKM